MSMLRSSPPETPSRNRVWAAREARGGTRGSHWEQSSIRALEVVAANRGQPAMSLTEV